MLFGVCKVKSLSLIAYQIAVDFLIRSKVRLFEWINKELEFEALVSDVI